MVLPCVPAMVMQGFRRINSASISARRTTGIWFSRAAIISALSAATAEETVTTPAPSIFSAAWPTAIFNPISRKRRVLALSPKSLPCTSYPITCMTSAMPLMPMPPMPTMWTRPKERKPAGLEMALSIFNLRRAIDLHRAFLREAIDIAEQATGRIKLCIFAGIIGHALQAFFIAH